MRGASLAWERDGPQWPHRDRSRFVNAGGLRWHVQQMGQTMGLPAGLPTRQPIVEPVGEQPGQPIGKRPVALLIHGTGASTHSWRGLMPLLAARFTVIAMDLPGHAFTGTPPAAQLSLPAMARAVSGLVKALAVEVDLVVGHSAGAAIGARAVLDGLLAPKSLAAINGAFLPMAGLPGLVFPPVARLMAATPLASQLFSQLFARRSWDRASVEKLIRGTGSTLDAQGLALYGALVRDPRHAAGALGMMARWDLQPLARDLARLQTPLAMMVGGNDRAVPPRDAQRVRAIVPASTPCSVAMVPGAGHLAHEERPAEVARWLLGLALDEPPAPPGR